MPQIKKINILLPDLLRSRLIREVILIVLVALLIFWFAQEYDAFEYLVEKSRKHEDWELDELFTLLMISSFAFLFITVRNGKYLKLEIKRRFHAEKEIRKLAFFDSLTGLPNRDLCNNRLEHILVHAKRSQSLAAILFIDLDSFKAVNDTYGHDAGDYVLKETATRMSERLRSDDTLARIAGDEFIIILETLPTANSVSNLAENLIEAIEPAFVFDGNEAYIGLSIGIAIYPTDGETAEELIKNSDTAMYHAKDSGKNTFRFFSSELDQQAKTKLKISNQLRQAMELNEFTLHYQPIIDTGTNKIKGCEALLRWNNALLGSVPPDVFIPIAEDIGLISVIGDWVLLQACHQNKAWHDAGYKGLVMSVNMSVRQLEFENFVTTVQDCLTKSKLDANYLDLELTETTIMKNVDIAMLRLEQLKALGLSISLDDFGTGYSSMSYLCKLNIDRIKIDRSFIRYIPENKEDIITTKAIISLANNLNLKITAEGIETSEQKLFIEGTVVDSAQGFYYSKAVGAAEFELLLKQPNW
ncbi:GGDEF-domain containing protein [Colwellia sp. 75C3]|uniref:putative bifunctional diguanylate cyclase/phosphodiesterase n=1 Tax=Colwellia sp. 75C3 TaxID=888425 RepID=UPI000C336387|nr:EAL domain-containing protein [Colwellia sp. 75C3]PKG83518.1 GGDEF-domain containing protein [Colwellia sp. 75C3]